MYEILCDGTEIFDLLKTTKKVPGPHPSPCQ